MKKLKLLAAIFLITSSSILIEILYTRVFAVIYFSSFAFLMISLALFGYGISGVYVSLTQLAKKSNALRYLEFMVLAFCITLPVIFKITLTYTIDFLNLFHYPNYLLLLLNCIVLLVPFFLAGTALVLIFSLYSAEIGKFYFIDLVGAALGGLAIIPLMTQVGPERIILLIFLAFALLWAMISQSRVWLRFSVLAVLCIAFGLMYSHHESLFPLVAKAKKRDFISFYNNKLIEYSRWSPISKIDVSPAILLKSKMIWIDAGTMESRMVRTNPNLSQIKPKEWIHEALPYQLSQRKNSALVIGSAGGYEVLCGMTNGFKNIIAVEMDPEICHVVKDIPKYSQYIGNIFHQPGIHLVNEEGRSYLKRIERKFDVIHMVNSHNSNSLLSGGLSIAEAYIYTVESFKDYWNHLNDNGFVAIVHWFGERLFSTAYQALLEMKIPEPEKKFLIKQGRGGFNYFFLKKGNILPQEIYIVDEFLKDISYFTYAPDRKLNNIYYRIASPAFQQVLEESSINLRPVRDRSPYFNQGNLIGQFSFPNNPIVEKRSRMILDYGLIFSNSVYLSILFLSLLLAFVLIYLPLRIKGGKQADFKSITYFFLIGFAYIMVEIVLIKIFQLYLGNPAYSISVIIFSLLVSSGIGSLMSGAVQRWLKKKTILWLAFFICVILLAYSLVLFQIVYHLIHLSLAGRLIISLLLISLLGLPMGVFFPTGMKFLGETDPILIGWAWGANAFASVLGSVLTVILAINLDFIWTLRIAAIAYLTAGFIFYFRQKKLTGDAHE